MRPSNPTITWASALPLSLPTTQMKSRDKRGNHGSRALVGSVVFWVVVSLPLWRVLLRESLTEITGANNNNNKAWDKNFFKIILPNEYVFRQLTYRSALHHSGQETGNGASRDTSAVNPLFGMDVSLLGEAIPWKIAGLELSYQIPPVPKRAVQ